MFTYRYGRIRMSLFVPLTPEERALEHAADLVPAVQPPHRLSAPVPRAALCHTPPMPVVRRGVLAGPGMRPVLLDSMPRTQRARRLATGRCKAITPSHHGAYFVRTSKNNC